MLEKLTPAAHMLRLRGSEAAAEQLQLRQQQDNSNSSGGGAVVGNNTTKAALSPLAAVSHAGAAHRALLRAPSGPGHFHSLSLFILTRRQWAWALEAGTDDRIHMYL